MKKQVSQKKNPKKISKSNLKTKKGGRVRLTPEEAAAQIAEQEAALAELLK